MFGPLLFCRSSFIHIRGCRCCRAPVNLKTCRLWRLWGNVNGRGPASPACIAIAFIFDDNGYDIILGNVLRSVGHGRLTCFVFCGRAVCPVEVELLVVISMCLYVLEYRVCALGFLPLARQKDCY